VLEIKRGPGRLFGAVLKSQLQEAIGLYHAFHDPEKKLCGYDKRVRTIEGEVSYHLRPRALKDRDNQRLLKEIGRHHARGNLLRFLYPPGLHGCNAFGRYRMNRPSSNRLTTLPNALCARQSSRAKCPSVQRTSGGRRLYPLSKASLAR
jgi:hypothetical protein